MRIPFSSMRFVSIDHRFGNGFGSQFWCLFDTFTVPTYNLLNHQKHWFSQWISMILPSRETWVLMIFMIFFVTSFCIDLWWVVASFWVPFWVPFGIKFTVLWWSFFLWFFELICYRLCTKLAPKSRRMVPSIFGFCSWPVPAQLHLYCSKTYKCQKPRFPTFLKTTRPKNPTS